MTVELLQTRRVAMLKRLAFGIVALFLLQGPSPAAASADLTYLINNRDTIRVYLDGFTNESGQDRIRADVFKKAVEKAMVNRKAVSFDVVSAPESSDVRVSCAITKYLYSKTDPVTSYGGPLALALDAATTENYVEMTADFTVTETGTGKILWKDSVKSFLKHTMTPEESVPMIYEKLSRDFLWKSFGKKR
jgi:hypothetical protein